ncbi:spore coat protein [Salipaludibacillus neizhouensis]|uniref:Spore coat protein n=1 Tax=Salipaludibacillus neizhouensis TaxID=885475 RepID=A0A3A9KQT8_9BACI|nr:spore coat protein [Salipaludibacillus neizhouensis]RKL67036.1 spore coat protein [Salipaludibacillus neizhouensis]
MENYYPDHLAWHETLEIHELTAFQSIGLMKLKKAYPEVTDPALKELYTHAINGLSTNIRELLEFYPLAPRSDEDDDEFRNAETPFYAGDLLVLFKTGVRNYAIAITETATPAVRKVLKQQLIRAIDTHAKVFNYMYEKSYYPSYNLEQLLQNDINLANKALNKSI